MGLSKSGLFAHFGSKEMLQRAVLEATMDRVINEVLRPAFREPTGEPRVRALFERSIRWVANENLTGGCPLIAAAIELDDQPGPLRDYLSENQKQLMQTLAGAAQRAVERGHFRSDLDTLQFAFELYSIVLGCNFWRRLLRDPDAEKRAHQAFERLVSESRP
jgi:AcrR family transcriptional regulator